MKFKVIFVCLYITNPFLILGMITRKLKLEGQISFFKTLPKLNFNVNIRDKDDPYSDFEKNAAKNWKRPQSVIIINASPRAGN